MSGKILMIVFVSILIVFCLVLALDLKTSVKTAAVRTVTRPSRRRPNGKVPENPKTENKFAAKAKKAWNKTSNTKPVFAPTVYAKGPEADGFKKYPVLKDVTTVGRGNDNDVILRDPAVSEYHGEILKVRDKEGFYYIYRNLSKTNPTEYLNQEEKKYEWLDYKDEVFLGDKEGFYIGETKVIIKTPMMGHNPEKDDLSVTNVEKDEHDAAVPDSTRNASGRAPDRDDVFDCL